jgi:hypothetical protein
VTEIDYADTSLVDTSESSRESTMVATDRWLQALVSSTQQSIVSSEHDGTVQVTSTSTYTTPLVRFRAQNEVTTEPRVLIDTKNPVSVDREIETTLFMDIVEFLRTGVHPFTRPGHAQELTAWSLMYHEISDATTEELTNTFKRVFDRIVNDEIPTVTDILRVYRIKALIKNAHIPLLQRRVYMQYLPTKLKEFVAANRKLIVYDDEWWQEQQRSRLNLRMFNYTATAWWYTTKLNHYNSLYIKSTGIPASNVRPEFLEDFRQIERQISRWMGSFTVVNTLASAANTIKAWMRQYALGGEEQQQQQNMGVKFRYLSTTSTDEDRSSYVNPVGLVVIASMHHAWTIGDHQHTKYDDIRISHIFNELMHM